MLSAEELDNRTVERAIMLARAVGLLTILSNDNASELYVQETKDKAKALIEQFDAFCAEVWQ